MPPPITLTRYQIYSTGPSAHTPMQKEGKPRTNRRCVVVHKRMHTAALLQVARRAARAWHTGAHDAAVDRRARVEPAVRGERHRLLARPLLVLRLVGVVARRRAVRVELDREGVLAVLVRGRVVVERELGGLADARGERGLGGGAPCGAAAEVEGRALVLCGLFEVVLFLDRTREEDLRLCEQKGRARRGRGVQRG